MTQRSVIHASFTIEQFFDAPPQRVFRAFSDPAEKAAWFDGPSDWVKGENVIDFRVGGREVNVGGPPGGPMHAFEAHFHDIVPGERLVYAYTMKMDDVLISVSLATIEFRPEGGGTRLVFTETGAFLDGHEDPALREGGTRWIMQTLAEYLAKALALA